MMALRLLWRPSDDGLKTNLARSHQASGGASWRRPHQPCVDGRFFFLKDEHDSAERAAIQNSTNLAGAFEEHLSRSLNEIDRSLKIIRTLYGRDPGKSG